MNACLLLQSNQWLAEVGWEEDVRWDSNYSPPSSPVLPDMNDPNLIFQLLRSTEDDDSQKAAALVLEPKPKVIREHHDPQSCWSNLYMPTCARPILGCMETYLQTCPCLEEMQVHPNGMSWV